LKTSLVLAAESGHIKIVKLLVKFGANVEAADEVCSTKLAVFHYDTLSIEFVG